VGSESRDGANTTSAWTSLPRHSASTAATLGLIEAACILWRYPHTDFRDGMLVLLYGALGYALAAAVVARTWMLVRPQRGSSSSAAVGIGIAVATLLSLHQVLALVLRHDATLAWLIPGCVLAGAAGGVVASALASRVALLRSRALWRSATVLALASALALVVTSELAKRRIGAAAAHDGSPNVLVISIDTLRADHLGGYGRQPSHTPSLDAFAAAGALFEHAAAPIPLTGPSHTTMLTGVYPASHGARSNGVPIRRGVVTVPELLGDAGYRTAAFVSGWPLKNEASGLASHFRHYDEDFALSPLLPSAALRLPPLALPARALRIALGTRLDPQEREGDRTVDRTLAWLGRADPRPFFAFVHLYEPHNPYAPPRHYRELLDPAYTGSIERFDPFTLGPLGFDRVVRDPGAVTHVARLYEAEVAWVDALLGRMLEGLAAQGVADSTLVIVTADHGESMTEHGEMFGHSEYLYETMTHVPLILRFPQGRFAGTRKTGLVRLVDLTPTILDVTHVAASAELDGQSLMPILDGRETDDARIAFGTVESGRAEHARSKHYARRRDLKLIWSFDRRGRESPPVEEIYDLGRDPGERQNLAPMTSAETDVLRAALRTWLARPTTALPSVDADVQGQLHALGYL